MAIVGKTIRLRPFERSDVTLKVQWINDPDVYRFLGYEIPLGVTRTEVWFDGKAGDESRRDFVIETPGGEPIGLVGLVGIDMRYRTAEIYVAIGNKDYWGKGVVSEAEALTIQWAFDWLGLERIWAHADIRNTASIVMMKRLGFKVEGTLREHRYVGGQRTDVASMGLLRREFRPPAGLFDAEEH